MLISFVGPRPVYALAAALWAALLIEPLAAFGFVDSSSTFAAVEVKEPLPLDPLVSGAVWQRGVKASDFFNYTTRQPAGPGLATTAYILYDEKFFYVGFLCEQTSVPIVANQTTNGVGQGLDDQVQVDIDTSGNGSRVYTFITTPRGIRYQESTESGRYDPPWQAAAATHPGGWSAMLSIPLQDLRASTGSSQTWRINLQRRLAARNEVFTWAYNPKMNDEYDTTYYPALTGLRISARSTRPKPHAEVFALSSSGLDRNQFQQTNGTFAYEPVRNFGADVTYPFTNTAALVGTVYPDFSNVEVDQQTIAPQEFQRQLAEYRPFFALGAPYLTPSMSYYIQNGAPDKVFYSPSIGTFNWGAKVEGTQRSDALGLLAIGGPGFDDQAFGFNHSTDTQDFRYFLDSVLAHHTQDGTSVTPCPGVLLTCNDSTFELGALKANRASGWASSFDYAAETGSYVGDAAQAHSFIFDVSRNMPFSGFEAGYRNIGPLYGPVDGYTQLADIRGYYADYGGGGEGSPNSGLKHYGGFIAAERYVDAGGQVHYAEMSGGLDFTFKNLLSIELSPTTSELLTSSGYPLYQNSQTLPYNTTTVTLGYGHNTASPVSLSYSWGPFATQCAVPPSTTTPNPLFCALVSPNLYANFYLQQVNGLISHEFLSRFTISLQYAGSDERPFAGPIDSQWLRRLSLGANVSANSSVSLDLRSISGTGGFSYPGINLAASFHDRFGGGNELYVNFGSPAASATLDRLIVKYVLHIGAGGVGT